MTDDEPDRTSLLQYLARGFITVDAGSPGAVNPLITPAICTFCFRKNHPSFRDFVIISGSVSGACFHFSHSCLFLFYLSFSRAFCIIIILHCKRLSIHFPVSILNPDLSRKMENTDFFSLTLRRKTSNKNFEPPRQILSSAKAL